MRVLFAAAELAPVARVGGLAEAAGGLVVALRRSGVEVDVVLPDYGDLELRRQSDSALDVPEWAGPARVRRGVHPDAGELTLVSVPGMARPHPYVDEAGRPWPDNEARFIAFACAVARWARRTGPDVVHLNDWHTAAATAFLGSAAPSVLTIHTLGYQGVTDSRWLKLLPNSEHFEWYGGTNPLAGGIVLADRVVTVSPNYAREILGPDMGMGLNELLAQRSTPPIGIRNGIDTELWDPATDHEIATHFDTESPEGRTDCRRDLSAACGWPDDSELLLGVVSRLVHQKGIDILASVLPYVYRLPARLVVLGSGEPELAALLRGEADDRPDRLAFTDGYDSGLARRIFAGVDGLVMPSRFEPCGLAQMQAMRYGAVPVVAPVGGLVDTVIDADTHPRAGTGFVCGGADAAGLVDALHRLRRASRNSSRMAGIRRRGMAIDWSWDTPATRQIEIYDELTTSSA